MLKDGFLGMLLGTLGGGLLGTMLTGKDVMPLTKSGRQLMEIFVQVMELFVRADKDFLCRLIL